MKPLNSYQDIIVPAQDKRDYLIELAIEEFHSTGSCVNGEVSRDEIIAFDMEDHGLHLISQSISGNLSYNDIEMTRKKFNSVLMDRICEAVDDVMFEMELTKQEMNADD